MYYYTNYMEEDDNRQKKSLLSKLLDFNKKTDKVWYKFSVIVWIIVFIYVLLVLIF